MSKLLIYKVKKRVLIHNYINSTVQKYQNKLLVSQRYTPQQLLAIFYFIQFDLIMMKQQAFSVCLTDDSFSLNGIFPVERAQYVGRI